MDRKDFASHNERVVFEALRKTNRAKQQMKRENYEAAVSEVEELEVYLDAVMFQISPLYRMNADGSERERKPE